MVSNLIVWQENLTILRRSAKVTNRGITSSSFDLDLRIASKRKYDDLSLIGRSDLPDERLLYDCGRPTSEERETATLRFGNDARCAEVHDRKCIEETGMRGEGQHRRVLSLRFPALDLQMMKSTANK